MKLTASRWIAAVSALAALGPADAARRPHYGGELRVEIHAAFRSINDAQADLVPSVFETLVRLDDRGTPRPWLATSWTHDASRKAWIFTPRGGVVLHNGEVWSPGEIAVADDKPIASILRDLSRPRNAIVIRSPDGGLIGTGPFKISRWDPGKSATLAAHDPYWGGRPYLDTVVIRMARSPAEQAVDLQLGNADVVEDEITNLRARKQSGTPFSITEPNQVLALVFDKRVPENLREAVALSVDRDTLVNVILEKQGEASAALLPRPVSGYSFLFDTPRNIGRARQLAGSAASLTFAYDAQNPLIRPVAQRVAVNVQEAGIALRPSQNGADVRLALLAVRSRDPWLALEDLAEALQLPWTDAPGPYQAERALLGNHRVVPLAHVPTMWSLSPRVRNWPRIADVWLDAGDRP